MHPPPSPYILRAMRLADIQDVMSIERESFPSSWSAAGYRHELTANPLAHYVVLEVQTATGSPVIIGYAGHWLVAGEAHVSTIAVAPQWRRKGLGALLLTWLIDHALEHDSSVISLEVRESNVPAQSLYLGYGFERVGRRRRYYRDTGEDAVLMDLNLAQPDLEEMLEERRVGLWRRLRDESLSD